MAWRDQLRPASFRGVEFLYDGAEIEGGRRLASHEYAGRNDAFHEDLGRATRKHSIDAYLLEPDHLAKVDRLIEACEKEGPGELIHPYLGTRQVSVPEGGYRCRFTTREGGMAVVTLTFLEGGENEQPAARPNTGAAVTRAADTSLLSTQSVFARDFNILGRPGWVGSSAQNVLGQAIDQIMGAGSTLRMPGAQAAAFRSQGLGLQGSLASLMRSPGDLAGQFASLFRSYRGSGVSSSSVYSANNSLTSFGSTLPAVPATTTTRQAEAANQAAIVAMVRQTATIEAARASSTMEFQTYDDAVAVRTNLSDRLDDQMRTARRPAFQDLRGLRAAIVRDITNRGADRPRLVTLTPLRTRPALAIANQHYGDDTSAIVARAGEIRSRNRVRHPSFVQGGRPLQVLSNV